MTPSRRDFIRKTSAAGIGAIVASKVSPLLAFEGSSAETMRVAVMGLNGRGMVFARSFARGPNTTVAYLCDVDANVLARASAETPSQATPPKGIADIRRALDDKDVDAIVIAAPDHWHAPATLMALAAGKHVYLEKPSGHNPREDELLIEAARKYPKLHVQLGTQRRSSPRFAEIIQQVREGLIGTPYQARAWYANTRATIGKGKPAPVPSHLNWELWQGPAPRTEYRDNVVHYNWHWFTRWGTGEVCNNGTHEIDVARWILGVDYPTTVYSIGSRRHFDDDWQFPDNQEVVYEYEGGKSIIWQGLSCNGLALYGRGRGTVIIGTNGSLVIDQDGYVAYDLKNKVVKEQQGVRGDPLNTIGDDGLTQLHVDNFTNAVRTGTRLSAPIEDGAKTGLICHLATIAHQTQRKLTTDPKTGRIKGDAEAMKLWSRDYDARWKPVV
ncbi:MAG: Gfo/Idh/MocA family protein [Gemmatimonadaceae bacterium]